MLQYSYPVRTAKLVVPRIESHRNRTAAGTSYDNDFDGSGVLFTRTGIMLHVFSLKAGRQWLPNIVEIEKNHTRAV